MLYIIIIDIPFNKVISFNCDGTIFNIDVSIPWLLKSILCNEKTNYRLYLTDISCKNKLNRIILAEYIRPLNLYAAVNQ